MEQYIEGYNNKLKNRLFSLLCEYEKGGEWEAYLDAIIIELLGIPVAARGINFYSLFSKISALKYLSYKYFRKTIFDCMSILGKTDSLIGDAYEL